MEQNTAFEKWFKKDYPSDDMSKDENGNYLYMACGRAWNTWKSATTESEKRIAQLESEVAESNKSYITLQDSTTLIANKYLEQQAHNKYLREALLQASRHLDLLEPSSTVCKIVSEALSAIPAESLAKHDAEVIEKALNNIELSLRDAGASIPAPEIKGTLESSIITGLSIALSLLYREKEALKGK